MSVVGKSEDTSTDAVARQLLQTLQAQRLKEHSVPVDFHDVLKKLVSDRRPIDHVHDVSPAERIADPAASATTESGVVPITLPNAK